VSVLAQDSALPGRIRTWVRIRTWGMSGYVQAVVAVLAGTALSWLLHPFVDLANLTMPYLLGVVAVAKLHGTGPSLAASIGSVAAFDFFFVPPFFTFAIADTQYLMTFGVMFLVAVVIGGLTGRIARDADAARQRERHTAELYVMSRELAKAATVDDLVDSGVSHVAAVFRGDVALFLPADGGALTMRRSEGGVRAWESGPTEWVFAHGQPAGLGTSEWPAARALYVPLVGHRGILGTLAIRPRQRSAIETAEARHQLETLVNQIALAVERAQLADEAQAARVRAETERLRNALLTSVSHDLRTPLATITGAVTTILDNGSRLPLRTQQELLESVRDEAERLNRLVQNLLEMTRLESGTLQVRRDWHPLEEVVGAALARLGARLGERRITVSVPSDLPLVPIDDVLIEQVLVNLVDNAIKHTPAESPVRIVATASDRAVTVEVADRGPGLPRGAEDRVFDKFYRASSDGQRGSGLGLAICRGVVETHGGHIWAQNLPEGGVAFLFTLPLTGVPPAAVPVDV
jgi:two-component system sensor histidine kinase KdpD